MTEERKEGRKGLKAGLTKKGGRNCYRRGDRRYGGREKEGGDEGRRGRREEERKGGRGKKGLKGLGTGAR